jgi:YbbR domain-containing protein
MSNLRASLLRVLLAVGLSFALWAFVSFSQNPEATVTFPDVPLEAVGLEPGLVMVDVNGVPTQALPPVDITLSTDQRQLAQLRPVDVRAVADLTGRGAGEHIVPVNVQPTRANLSFTVPDGGAAPAAVPVRLEALSTREVPVGLEVQGNLPFSFERGDPTITSGGQPIQAVTVQGPQSRVERVVQARATANIEQLRATYQAALPLTALDAAGVPLDGVVITPSAVTVEIPINPVVGIKLVPVVPDIAGLPAAGYQVTGVTVSPPLIALTGASGPLDRVGELRTARVDIAGATGPISRTVRLIFPENTSPGENMPEVVRVVVAVAPIALPFQAEVPAAVSATGVGAGLQLGVSPSVATVTVSGPSAAIAALGQTPLRATVDVSGLGPGTYQLPVSVALPQGVGLVGDPPTVQVTLRFPPPPTGTPGPAGTPGATGTPGPTDTPGPSPTPGAPPPTATAAPQEPAATPAPTPPGGATPTP